MGEYVSPAPLSNITIIGLQKRPSNVVATFGTDRKVHLRWDYEDRILKITSLEAATAAGAWNREFAIEIGQPPVAQEGQQAVLEEF